jgi:hypothetical protein
VKRLALVVLLVLFVAACGAKQPSVPTTALLTGIQVHARSIDFDFKTAPLAVSATYSRARLISCGSGAVVPLRGRVHLVVRFRPAQTDLAFGAHRRLSGQGPFLELAKVCDFEADLAWAIGFDKQHAYRVERQGSRVTIQLS